MTQLAVIALLIIGLFFLLVAAIGFIRLPDLYCRLHVTGIMDTLGAPLIMLAATVHEGLSLTTGKLILTIIFLYLTAPVSGHLLSRAAMEGGYMPQLAPLDSAESAKNTPTPASDQ